MGNESSRIEKRGTFIHGHRLSFLFSGIPRRIAVFGKDFERQWLWWNTTRAFWFVNYLSVLMVLGFFFFVKANGYFLANFDISMKMNQKFAKMTFIITKKSRHIVMFRICHKVIIPMLFILYGTFVDATMIVVVVINLDYHIKGKYAPIKCYYSFLSPVFNSQ